MINENILKYLRGNKDKFSQQVLKEKLVGAGYPRDQIGEGIRIIYGGEVPPSPAAGAKTSFWDFKSARTYTSSGEKFVDFLAGFFAPPVAVFVSSFFFGGFFNILGLMPRSFFYGFGPLTWIFPLAGFIFHIWAIFYFWKRRRYLARGLLFILILPLTFIGIGIFIFFVLFRGGRYFL